MEASVANCMPMSRVPNSDAEMAAILGIIDDDLALTSSAEVSQFVPMREDVLVGTDFVCGGWIATQSVLRDVEHREKPGR
jgi:hypothetical protein